jgi:type VI secretion system protein ImpA
MGYEVQFAGLVNAGLGIAVESFVAGQSATSSAPSGRAAWLELEEQLVDLFRQTKHVDMLYLLALTEVHLHSISGLIEGLDYTNSLLDRHWDDLHPTDSEADYEFRRDGLTKLDTPAFASWLDGMTIADDKRLGTFSLGAWLAAMRNKDSNPNQLTTIEQALAGTFKERPSFYDEIAGQINELQASMGRLELTVKDKFVSFRLPFMALKAKLAEIGKLIAGFCNVAIEGIEQTGPAQAGGQASLAVPGEIASREDVIETLAKIILYYTKNEPASPVPALLKRAQRVATMSFKEIVQEFNLTGTPSIPEVLGWKNEDT